MPALLAPPPIHAPAICCQTSSLAPKVEAAVLAALAECHKKGLDARIYETIRSPELQEYYFAKGRTIESEEGIVTKVKDVMYGWHFYGIAIDVISAKNEWRVTAVWRKKVTAIFLKHGFRWGGEFGDTPHYWWGKAAKGPSDKARLLYKDGGLRAVWVAVGAV